MDQWLGALRVLRQETNVARLREQACELAEHLTGADGAFCAIHESELCVSQSTLGVHGVVDSATVRVGECGCGILCSSEDATGSVVDLRRAGPEVRAIFAAQSPTLVVVVPLVLEGKRVGTLGIVYREPTTLGELGRRFLRMIGEAVATGLALAFEESPPSRSASRSDTPRSGLREASGVARRLRALVDALGDATVPWPSRALSELREGLSNIEREVGSDAAAPPVSSRRGERCEEFDFAELAAGVAEDRPERGDGSVVVRKRRFRFVANLEAVRNVLGVVVKGALVSLAGARVTMGVRRSGASARLFVVERGIERTGGALYLGGALDGAKRAGLELRVSFGRGGLLWELELPLALSETWAGLERETRPTVALFIRDLRGSRELGGLLVRCGLSPLEGADASDRARLAIVEWGEGATERVRALRSRRGPDFPLVLLTKEAPSAEALGELGQPRLLRMPVREAELTLAVRLALAREDHPRRPRASEVFPIAGERRRTPPARTAGEPRGQKS